MGEGGREMSRGSVETDLNMSEGDGLGREEG